MYCDESLPNFCDVVTEKYQKYGLMLFFLFSVCFVILIWIDFFLKNTGMVFFLKAQ